MKSTSIKERVARRTALKSEVPATGESLEQKSVRFRTILVPVDYSASSRSAFRYALDLAEKFDSRVCLLHVVEHRNPGEFASMRRKAPETGSPAVARRELIALARSGGHPFVPVSPEIRCGEPWEEIVAAARREGADLIVISTQGRTGLKNVLMGSVTEKVVRRAPCAVLVLHNETVDLLVTRDVPATATLERTA